jgi:hypothetical protein
VKVMRIADEFHPIPEKNCAGNHTK